MCNVELYSGNEAKKALKLLAPHLVEEPASGQHQKSQEERRDRQEWIKTKRIIDRLNLYPL